MRAQLKSAKCACGCGTAIDPKGTRGRIRQYAPGHHKARSWQERFWEKVNKAGPLVVATLGPCWKWLASHDQQGYGQFDTRKGFEHKAHRAAWLAVNGEIPNDLRVLHKCDNTGCVNPAHLFLGTYQDNSDDMKAKGRSCKGELISLAKLTAEDIRYIRSVYDGKAFSYRSLGRKYAVTYTAIASIVKGRTWRHVA